MLVVVLGVIRAIVRHAGALLKRSSLSPASQRLELTQSMVFGLEFLVAADIVKTVVSPTWNDILLLASLIGLRTVLNYFLERELSILNTDMRSTDGPSGWMGSDADGGTLAAAKNPGSVSRTD